MKSYCTWKSCDVLWLLLVLRSLTVHYCYFILASLAHLFITAALGLTWFPAGLNHLEVVQKQCDPFFIIRPSGDLPENGAMLLLLLQVRGLNLDSVSFQTKQIMTVHCVHCVLCSGQSTTAVPLAANRWKVKHDSPERQSLNICWIDYL